MRVVLIGHAKFIESQNNSVGYFSMGQSACLDPEISSLMVKWGALL